MTVALTHSPADILSRILIAKGYGEAPSSTRWPIFVAAEPNTPDNVITIYDTTGITDGRSMFGDLATHFGIQVRIRAKDHPTGWIKADAIRNGMAENILQETVEIDGTQYLVDCVSKIGSVLVIGMDTPGTKRRLFTINAMMTATVL